MASTRPARIDTLIHQAPQLWRGRAPNYSQRTLPTGHARLDAQLPGNGWPLGAVTEILSEAPGLGELSLLIPALAELGRKGQWLVLIDPPWIPYPGALHGHGLALERLLVVNSSNAKESLWACEQVLRGKQGGTVLAWPQQISFAQLRRLQLAAETGNKTAFLFRPEQAAQAASPAALRVRLRPGEPDASQGIHDVRSTRIDILKCRGERPRDPVWLSRLSQGDLLHALPLQPVEYSGVLPPARSGPVNTCPAVDPMAVPAPSSLN